LKLTSRLKSREIGGQVFCPLNPGKNERAAIRLVRGIAADFLAVKRRMFFEN
jgi:hypothetical protein